MLMVLLEQRVWNCQPFWPLLFLSNQESCNVLVQHFKFFLVISSCICDLRASIRIERLSLLARWLVSEDQSCLSGDALLFAIFQLRWWWNGQVVFIWLRDCFFQLVIAAPRFTHVRGLDISLDGDMRWLLLSEGRLLNLLVEGLRNFHLPFFIRSEARACVLWIGRNDSFLMLLLLIQLALHHLSLHHFLRIFFSFGLYGLVQFYLVFGEDNHVLFFWTALIKVWLDWFLRDWVLSELNVAGSFTWWLLLHQVSWLLHWLNALIFWITHFTAVKT